MEGNLTIFEYESQEIRTFVIDGEPWFVAKDICRAFGISNYHNAISVLDDDEKGLHIMETPGGSQSISIMSESGAYYTGLRSRKKDMKRFRRWVTSDILPSIRKTGQYAIEQPTPLQIGEMFVKAEKERLALEDRIKEEKPYTDFGKKYASSEGTVLMRDVAKAIGTGQNKLWAFLRKREVVNWNNRPYQEYFDRGYFVDNLGYHDEKDKRVSHRTVRVTTKGQVYIANLWSSDAGEPKLIPLM